MYTYAEALSTLVNRPISYDVKCHCKQNIIMCNNLLLCKSVVREKTVLMSNILILYKTEIRLSQKTGLTSYRRMLLYRAELTGLMPNSSLRRG